MAMAVTCSIIVWRAHAYDLLVCCHMLAQPLHAEFGSLDAHKCADVGARLKGLSKYTNNPGQQSLAQAQSILQVQAHPNIELTCSIQSSSVASDSSGSSWVYMNFSTCAAASCSGRASVNVMTRHPGHQPSPRILEVPVLARIALKYPDPEVITASWSL